MGAAGVECPVPSLVPLCFPGSQLADFLLDALSLVEQGLRQGLPVLQQQEQSRVGFSSFPFAVRKPTCCFLCLVSLHTYTEPHVGLRLFAFETHSGHFSW